MELHGKTIKQNTLQRLSACAKSKRLRIDCQHSCISTMNMEVVKNFFRPETMAAFQFLKFFLHNILYCYASLFACPQ